MMPIVEGRMMPGKIVMQRLVTEGTLSITVPHSDVITSSEDRRVILEYLAHMLDSMDELRAMFYRPTGNTTYFVLTRGPVTPIEQEIRDVLEGAVIASEPCLPLK